MLMSRASAMDVVYKWGLYTMFRKDVVSEELKTVEKILDICDSITADFLSLEELQSKFDENPEICNTFVPTEKMSFGMGLCSCHFDEFQQKLEFVLREGTEVATASISESNFQTLFEDFLKICGIITRMVLEVDLRGMPLVNEGQLTINPRMTYCRFYRVRVRVKEGWTYCKPVESESMQFWKVDILWYQL